MTTEKRICDYEQAAIAILTHVPTTAIWRAYRDAEAALLDHVRRFGPAWREGKVYAEHGGELLVIRGVRTCGEIDGEAAGEG